MSGATQYSVNYVSGSDKISSLSSIAGTISYTSNARGDRWTDHQGHPRYYYYDGRRRVKGAEGYHIYSGGIYYHTIVYSYDHKNRLIFRSYYDHRTDIESQTFYYYDVDSRLIEVKSVPNIGSPSTYTIYDFYWLGQRPVALWATDFPAASVARYFMHADESNKVLEMYSWPTSGNASRVWAINPDVFGWDNVVEGSLLYQPLRSDNAMEDEGTIAYKDTVTLSRPPLQLAKGRQYDPMTATMIQRTGEWPTEPYGRYGRAPVVPWVGDGSEPDSGTNTVARPDLPLVSIRLWFDAFVGDLVGVTCADVDEHNEGPGCWGGGGGGPTVAKPCSECDREYEEDSNVCRAMPNGTKVEKALRALCWAWAIDKYAEC